MCLTKIVPLCAAQYMFIRTFYTNHVLVVFNKKQKVTFPDLKNCAVSVRKGKPHKNIESLSKIIYNFIICSAHNLYTLTSLFWIRNESGKKSFAKLLFFTIA